MAAAAADAYDDDDFDAYDDDDDDGDGDGDGDGDEDNEEEDEYNWGLFSSPAPLPPPPDDNTPTFRPSTLLPTSPRCSMDDDSSTDGEDEVLMPSSSRHHVSPPPSLEGSADQQPSDSPATSLQQRRAKIKELQLKYQKECLIHCRNLIVLQQQWRQELEDPEPGLLNDEYLMQETLKQKGSVQSKSEMHSSVVAASRSRATSATTSNYKHPAVSAKAKK